MKDLVIKHVKLWRHDNQKLHQTEGFVGAKALVVRRGNPFRISLKLNERPFNPKTDALVFKFSIGHLFVKRSVTFSKVSLCSRWGACMDPEGPDLQCPSILISTPATAPVGTYSIQMFVFTPSSRKSYRLGNFTLLCNPWCSKDAVFLSFEDQREEYIQNDSGLLYMGTPLSVAARPWSFDQFEPDILEACLSLLQVSPQHLTNPVKDYKSRADPIYISRVVSAMINSEDDRGVLTGKWSGDFTQGVDPSTWTGSGDILTQWAKSGFSPVMYGQCWVFAAVMCTVMRVLGIPCRVVTNYNSAHDTNGNLVIEEFYNELGKKLPHSKDSIWNFHVWVECWMTRKDLGSDLNGWQVLDPTPQERSAGVFCCGPAPVRALRDRRIELPYDIPFVYAEVMASVHTVVLREGQVVCSSRDTKRVGSLICTKAVGHPRPENITGDYKHVKSPNSTLRSRRRHNSDDTVSSNSTSQGVSVTLTLEKAPVAGVPITFRVTITNKETVAKEIIEHLNAQAKQYNHSPSDTFWEAESVVKLAPLEVRVVRHQISPVHYEDVVGDDLINLAVVLEDPYNQQRVLACEEFNIENPQLDVEIMKEGAVNRGTQQTAVVSFTNPFSVPVSGVLTIRAAGLKLGEREFRILNLPPGGRVQQSLSFVPKKAGTRMIQARLDLTNRAVVRGYQMVTVNRN
ncbi:transglutaminase 5, like [Gadus chalcogrammus]|uniref:transglutaminase 5, like n=1 Tax=Gadus chalcogrammus TaxID=1042646 RepID=UPI0024C49979|nr:transglutaminase 5, like [Gadus chalcogrammus]